MRKNASVCTKILLMSGFALIAGCSSLLVRDEAPPPIENGMNRVETIACGHHAVGNNVCWVGSQTNPKDVDLKVVTYLSGRLSVKSHGGGCEIDDAFRFEKGQEIDLDLSKYVQSFTKSCVIDFFMLVEFPGQKDTDVPTRGLSGRVVLAFSDLQKAEILPDGASFLRAWDDDLYAGAGLFSLRQQSGPYNPADKIRINTGGSKRGKIRVDGCGLQPLIFEYSNENPAVGLGVLIREKILSVDNCQLYGRVLRLDMADDSVFLINLEVYSKKVIVLEKAQVLFSGDEVRFSGSPEVSWTFVDTTAVNSTKGKAKTKEKTFVLRQLTAVGRTRVMKYEDGNLVWSK